MANKSIGFIETFGLAACVAAADAAVKSANVKLLGFEYAKGDGMCTVKVEGNVGACKAAIEAGKRAAEAVNGTLSGTKSVLLKARPADGMMDIMVNNRETVGGEIALAEGYRPAGDSKKPVLVKNWKPAEEPKVEVEAPIVEAPVSPVEEDLKEEAEEEDDADPESQEPAIEVVVEEAVEEAKTDEIIEEVAPVAEITEEEVVAPELEAEEEVVAPEESVVAPESEVKEEVVAPESEDVEVVEEPKDDKPVEVETSETEAPKKSTSTGNKRRSKRKKKSDN